MPRAQTNTVVAFATGRMMVDPKRFEGRDAPKHRKAEPLGDPPWYFDIVQRECWFRVTADWWWLDESDRVMVAAFCRVLTITEQLEVRCDPAYWNVLIRLSQLLGIAPTTRGKLLQERKLLGDEGEDDDKDI